MRGRMRRRPDSSFTHRKPGVLCWAIGLCLTVALSEGTVALADASVPRSPGRLEQGVVLARHADRWITWQPFRPPGHPVRLRLDDPEVFRRIPLKFPVELAIAPDGRHARLIGILE